MVTALSEWVVCDGYCTQCVSLCVVLLFSLPVQKRLSVSEEDLVESGYTVLGEAKRARLHSTRYSRGYSGKNENE